MRKARLVTLVGVIVSAVAACQPVASGPSAGASPTVPASASTTSAGAPTPTPTTSLAPPPQIPTRPPVTPGARVSDVEIGAKCDKFVYLAGNEFQSDDGTVACVDGVWVLIRAGGSSEPTGRPAAARAAAPESEAEIAADPEPSASSAPPDDAQCILGVVTILSVGDGRAARHVCTAREDGTTYWRQDSVASTVGPRPGTTPPAAIPTSSPTPDGPAAGGTR